VIALTQELSFKKTCLATEAHEITRKYSISKALLFRVFLCISVANIFSKNHSNQYRLIPSNQPVQTRGSQEFENTALMAGRPALDTVYLHDFPAHLQPLRCSPAVGLCL